MKELNHSDTVIQLKKLAKSFFELSGTILAVYDGKRNFICGYPDRMCAFCEYVRQNGALKKRCFAHDDAAFEVCSRTRTIYKYHCHMGLVEVASPIVKDDIILGYLLFGQIVDREDRSEITEHAAETARSFGLDEEQLCDNLQKIKYRSDRYISAISNLLEMSACYILMNNILSVRTGGLAFSVTEFIKAHLSDDLSVRALCGQFHISASTLYSISKRFYGRGIAEHITVLRIEKAKLLMSDGNCSVSEAAAAVGIEDANYFTKVFKAQVGVTPKKYQLKEREE